MSEQAPMAVENNGKDPVVAAEASGSDTSSDEDEPIANNNGASSAARAAPAATATAPRAPPQAPARDSPYCELQLAIGGGLLGQEEGKVSMFVEEGEKSAVAAAVLCAQLVWAARRRAGETGTSRGARCCRRSRKDTAACCR